MNIKCFNNTYLDAYMYIKYIIKNNIAINSNKYQLPLKKKLTDSFSDTQIQTIFKTIQFLKKYIILDTDYYYETLIKTLILNHLISSLK